MPRTHCGPDWTDGLVIAHLIGELGTALAYAAIPAFLLHVARKRRDLGLNTLLYWFAAFIGFCGLTHIQGALMFVWPAYRWDALLRILCMIASVGTVAQIPSLLPLLAKRKGSTAKSLPENDLFEAVFSYAPAGIVVVGLDGTLERVNREFSRITRRPEAELHDLDFQTITPEPYLSQDVDLFKRLVRREIPSYSLEKPYILPGKGQWVWVLLHTALILDEKGKPLYALGMVVDITSRKHAEEELVELRTTLEQRAEALVNRVQELEDLNRRSTEGAHAQLEEIIEQIRKDQGSL